MTMQFFKKIVILDTFEFENTWNISLIAGTSEFGQRCLEKSGDKSGTT
jgi:hypothetical protein